MRWLLVASLVAAGSALAMSSAAASPERHNPPRLIVLVVAGQSNALGYQSFVIDPKTHKDVFTEKGSSPADRSVPFIFEDSGIIGGALPPGPLDTPQKRRGAKSPIFGPEVGLARSLYRLGHRNLLVVKVAFSGSSLAVNWAPGSVDFSALVTRVQSAMAWAKDGGWSPTIRGFYWMQGESDAVKAPYAADYQQNLVHFISNIRTDLPLKSTTPIVIGQIDLSKYISYEQARNLCATKSCSSELRWNSEVMRAQASVTGKDVLLAKTSKLPRYLDDLHLTNAGELSLGKEFGSLTRSRI